MPQSILAPLLGTFLLTAGCGDDAGRPPDGATPPRDGSAPADAGSDPDSAVTPTAVSGRIVAEVDGDGPFPFEGATVTLVGADPPVETVSAADGTFSLEVMPGIVTLRAAATGHWAAIGAADVPVAGLTGVEIELLPDGVVDEIEIELGRTISADNGIFVVQFRDPSAGGGERASITASSDPPFIFSSSAGIIETDALQAGSEDFVAFVNVMPGTTAVTVSGVDGRSTCAVVPAGLSAWPIEAGMITYARAPCSSP